MKRDHVDRELQLVNEETEQVKGVIRTQTSLYLTQRDEVAANHATLVADVARLEVRTWARSRRDRSPCVFYKMVVRRLPKLFHRASPDLPKLFHRASPDCITTLCFPFALFGIVWWCHVWCA